MKNVLIHGLGQNSNDWKIVKSELGSRGISAVVPDLFRLAAGKELDYAAVYRAFSGLCDSYQAKINSLVLIGTPYDIPKRLLRFQNLVFKLIPKSMFQNMGISKKDFIHLSHSMIDLDFMQSAAQLDCPAFVLCGSKDKANMESAKRFHEAMKNSSLVVVEDSGHEVNRDNPQELVSILQSFWAENSDLKKSEFSSGLSPSCMSEVKNQSFASS